MDLPLFSYSTGETGSDPLDWFTDGPLVSAKIQDLFTYLELCETNMKITRRLFIFSFVKESNRLCIL